MTALVGTHVIGRVGPSPSWTCGCRSCRPGEHTDKVQINTAAGGIRVQVESAALKDDPVAATTLNVEPGMTGHTGVPIRILGIPSAGVALGVLLVRSSDTKADRTRWRVRDDHVDSLGEFSFLSTGKRGGQTRA